MPSADQTGIGMMFSRVALVIGNWEYKENARSLMGPADDAYRIAKLFEKLDFNVLQPRINVDKGLMRTNPPSGSLRRRWKRVDWPPSTIPATACRARRGQLPHARRCAAVRAGRRRGPMLRRRRDHREDRRKEMHGAAGSFSTPVATIRSGTFQAANVRSQRRSVSRAWRVAMLELPRTFWSPTPPTPT